MNSFGTHFRFTTFGESHGPTIGVVIDGCPAGVPLTEEFINERLLRRAPGQTPYTSPRHEKDTCRLVSGVFNQQTTGAPVTILIDNKDAESDKYTAISGLCRPGHANATYLAKYGIFDYRGGGRASARETAARVAAGAVAEAMLQQTGIKIFACLAQVGPHKAPGFEDALFDDHEELSQEQLCLSVSSPEQHPQGEPSQERPLQKHLALNGLSQGGLSQTLLNNMQKHLPLSPLFAPSPEADTLFGNAIMAVKKQRDSLGGVVNFFITNAPQGLGDPVYGKLSAKLAFALMSIPASKGFEIGKGFSSANATGSAFNDNFILHEQTDEKSSPAAPKASEAQQRGQTLSPFIRLGSNNAGGVLGGISTGDTIYGRVAFKPTPSVGIDQPTLTLDGQEALFALPKGSRHDPCLAVRAVPVVEAMCWVVLADTWLANRLARWMPDYAANNHISDGINSDDSNGDDNHNRNDSITDSITANLNGDIHENIHENINSAPQNKA